MNFSLLEGFHSKWQDILVIGKTTERNGRKYHIVGMTLSDEAKLYIIEPYMVLSCKLDAPVSCRLDAPDFGFVCHVLADCLHQHWQAI